MISQQLITSLLESAAALCALASALAALGTVLLASRTAAGQGAARCRGVENSPDDGSAASERYMAQLANFIAYNGSERGQRAVETDDNAE